MVVAINTKDCLSSEIECHQNRNFSMICINPYIPTPVQGFFTCTKWYGIRRQMKTGIVISGMITNWPDRILLGTWIPAFDA